MYRERERRERERERKRCKHERTCTHTHTHTHTHTQTCPYVSKCKHDDMYNVQAYVCLPAFTYINAWEQAGSCSA